MWVYKDRFKEYVTNSGDVMIRIVSNRRGVSGPGPLNTCISTTRGHKEMSSVWAGHIAPSYMSDRLERKRQDTGGASYYWPEKAVVEPN